MRIVMSMTFLILSSVLATAQIDELEFQRGLTQFIERNEASTYDFDAWTDQFDRLEDAYATGLVQSLVENPPTFGVAVVDAAGTTIEVFPSEAPISFENEQIVVSGYQLPAGATFQLLGSTGWGRAVMEATNSQRASYVDSASEFITDSFELAINRMGAASNFIASELCGLDSRPSTITLNLSVGFELVFDADTGSEVEWDLETMCPRMLEEE